MAFNRPFRTGLQAAVECRINGQTIPVIIESDLPPQILKLQSHHFREIRRDALRINSLVRYHAQWRIGCLLILCFGDIIELAH